MTSFITTSVKCLSESDRPLKGLCDQVQPVQLVQPVPVSESDRPLKGLCDQHNPQSNSEYNTSLNQTAR